MHPFEKKVCDFIKEYDLCKEKDAILLAVSGGADSVALLRFFSNVKEKLDVSIYAIHIEHGIRGQESLWDQAFVEKLCKDCDVDLSVVSVGHLLKKEIAAKKGLEEAARAARYEAFENEAARLEKETKKRVHIALAHHGDDNAETLLFHLARGTGLGGMRGIPVKRDRIIRPFMAVCRGEIEEYLFDLQQDYRVDSTNVDTSYDRNRIRHLILPELEKVNENARCHLNQEALYLGQVGDYIRSQAKNILDLATKENVEIHPGDKSLDGAKKLLIEALRQEPEFLRKEVILLWLERTIGSRKDLTSKHLGGIDDLIFSRAGSSISIPYGYVVRRDYDGLLLCALEGSSPDGLWHGSTEGSSSDGLMFDADEGSFSAGLMFDATEASSFDGIKLSSAEASSSADHEICIKKRELKKDKPVTFYFGQKHFKICLKDRDSSLEIPRNSYTKWFDYDKIKDEFSLRYRRGGDYLTVNSTGGHKSLQDYFVNEKISRWDRDAIPLLCEGDHVIWVIGYRISEYYKIDEHTNRILEIQMMEEKR